MGHWPRLDPGEDGATFALLHLASQMIGKVRLAHSVWQNHGWNITLRPTARGFATLPTAGPDGRLFTLALDLCRHGIALELGTGEEALLPFAGRTVAQLHSGLVAMLGAHGLPGRFDGRPSEIAEAVRFEEDDDPREYREDSAGRLHAAFQRIVPPFERFRAGFLGKASPVHFFWGSFDLAVTRFSGRTAPEHPGGVPGLPDRITREAYSHEVSSAGFWAGGVVAAPAMFYSYSYPEPAGFRSRAVTGGRFDEGLGEFVLDYDAVRAAGDPEAILTEFLQSSYAAAADLARWDRARLEREPVAP